MRFSPLHQQFIFVQASYDLIAVLVKFSREGVEALEECLREKLTGKGVRCRHNNINQRLRESSSRNFASIGHIS